MSSAPRKGWAEVVFLSADYEDNEFLRGGPIPHPVLAFDTEAERDEAALAIVDFDQSAADYLRMHEWCKVARSALEHAHDTGEKLAEMHDGTSTGNAGRMLAKRCEDALAGDTVKEVATLRARLQEAEATVARLQGEAEALHDALASCRRAGGVSDYVAPEAVGEVIALHIAQEKGMAERFAASRHEALDARDAALAEVERLTRERDEAFKTTAEYAKALATDRARFDFDALRARRESLEAALRFIGEQPCRHEAEGSGEGFPCSETSACITEWCHPCYARALLAPQGSPGERHAGRFGCVWCSYAADGTLYKRCGRDDCSHREPPEGSPGESERHTCGPCDCKYPDGPCEGCDDTHGHTCIHCGEEWCQACWRSFAHRNGCSDVGPPCPGCEPPEATETPGPDHAELLKLDYHECQFCAVKSGSPELCPSCLHNRDTIAALKAALR